jgi:hypothetical protein
MDETIKLLPQQAASKHMSGVILWSNGQVMVFDDQGQQMPEFQREFEEAAPLINAVFNGTWEYGDWNERWLGKACKMPRSRSEVMIAAILQTFKQVRDAQLKALCN